MEKKIRVSIVGASGYVGGELLRLLLSHQKVKIGQLTSNRYANIPVKHLFPYIFGNRIGEKLSFCPMVDLKECDLLFLALPHGQSMNMMDKFKRLAPKIIDLSSDFRLSDPEIYKEWYGNDHKNPELLKDFAYGICELYREKMKKACYISSAGCNATAVILALYPFYKNCLVKGDQSVVEVKAGTSQGGNKVTESSHHPIRKGAIRSYSPSGHRHIAEMIQELSFGKKTNIHFSATSIDMVRGVHMVGHLFLKEKLTEKDIWKVFRKEYGNEPFIRIIKSRRGVYRYPDPKVVVGTNFCDIGFELDERSNRVIVFSALDNLMKGAAGQAVQSFNIMNGFSETEGLRFSGLYPH